MARFISSINNFSVVLGAGLCLCAASYMLAWGSETVFHRELPFIGYFAMLSCGGKVLAGASKIKHSRVVMSGLGYTGMSAVMFVLIMWGAFNVALK